MKKHLTTLLSLALLAVAPLASQASGFGSEGVSLGLHGPQHTVAAKEGPFGEGTVAINVGIGLGSYYSTYLITGSASFSPAIIGSVEYGVRQIGPGILGIGGIVSYQGSSAESSGYKYSSSDVFVGVRGAYHYEVNSKFDAYAGVTIGVRRNHYSNTYSSAYYGFATDYDASAVTLQSGLFAGGRYMLANSIGVFAEVGYDITFLKAGVAFKF